MTLKGRSQQLPDEIHPQRERCAASWGKLSNEVSAITWKCGFEIYQFGHLQTIYTHDQVILAAAQYLTSWRKLYKQVWMMALQDRDGAELNVLGRQPHAFLAIPLPSFKSTKSSIKADPMEVTSKGGSGSSTPMLPANSFNNTYLLTKTPCSQGKVSKIFSTGPKQLLQELATRMFSIQWEYNSSKVVPFGQSQRDYFLSAFLLSF